MKSGVKLLIDAGNTRLKWCWVDGDDIPLEPDACEYEVFESDGVDVFITDGQEADEVLVCNVAGQDFEQELTTAFAYWDIRPRFVRSQVRQGEVINAYENPQDLGVDRWMALLGAWMQNKDAACIVDCGSAVTIDVLDDSGRHLGGLIVPGLEMMQNALLDGTSLTLDGKSQSRKSTSLLASDTVSAIEAGSIYAVVALIDRIRQDSEEALGRELPLLISGGDVDLIQPLLDGECSYEPLLIFHGMMVADGNHRPLKQSGR